MSMMIGLLGMAGILAAFLLDEFVKEWGQETLRYNLLNIMGAGLLVWYAITLNSWPFVILNGVWAVAALVKVVKIVGKERF